MHSVESNECEQKWEVTALQGEPEGDGEFYQVRAIRESATGYHKFFSPICTIDVGSPGVPLSQQRAKALADRIASDHNSRLTK